MLPRQQNIIGMQQLRYIAILGAVNYSVLAETAASDLRLVRKIRDPAFGKSRIIIAVRIIKVQDKPVSAVLHHKNTALCINIILIILMLIKMIRRNIRDYRYIRFTAHAVQLKRA